MFCRYYDPRNLHRRHLIFPEYSSALAYLFMLNPGLWILETRFSFLVTLSHGDKQVENDKDFLFKLSVNITTAYATESIPLDIYCIICYVKILHTLPLLMCRGRALLLRLFLYLATASEKP